MRGFCAVALVIAIWAQDTKTTQTSSRVPEVLARVNKERLKTGVETLVSFKTRNTYSAQNNTTEGIGAAYTWIYKEFKKIAKETKSRALVDYHHYTLRQTKARNVFYWKKGKKHPKKVIVHGAHLDSINVQTRRNNNAPAPGANDNASGTSAVLEMARILGNLPLDVGVILIAFSGEEQGLHGARAFVKFLKGMGVEVVAMINTDTIGGSIGDDGSRDPDTCRCFSAGPEGSRHRVFARYIRHLCSLYQPKFTVQVQNRIDRPRRGGDHQPFSDAGLTAVRLIVTKEETKKQHTPNDLPKHMDWDYHVRMARLVALTIMNLAYGPSSPAGVAIKGRTVSWRAVSGAKAYAVFVRKSGTNDRARVVQASGTKVEISDLGRGDGVAVSAISKAWEIGLPSPEVAVE